jgi:hypothetical protein
MVYEIYDVSKLNCAVTVYITGFRWVGGKATLIKVTNQINDVDHVDQPVAIDVPAQV